MDRFFEFVTASITCSTTGTIDQNGYWTSYNANDDEIYFGD